MQNPTKIEECKQNSIGWICCFELWREVLGGLFLWGQHHIVWVSVKTNILKYTWCTPEGRCWVHDSPFERRSSAAQLAGAKSTYYYLMPPHQLLMQTWKCSQDKHSHWKSGSWGKSLSLGWWKGFMKEAYQGKKWNHVKEIKSEPDIWRL